MNFNVIGVGEVLWDLLLTGAQVGRSAGELRLSCATRWARTPKSSRGWEMMITDAEIIRRFHESGPSGNYRASR